jgi:hypothetical protein
MPGNLPFVRDCMLRVARDSTGCLKSVVIFATQFRTHLIGSESEAVMTRWLKQSFAAHTHRGHDMEIANTLAICGVLGLRVDWDFIAPGATRCIGGCFGGARPAQRGRAAGRALGRVEAQRLSFFRKHRQWSVLAPILRGGPTEMDKRLRSDRGVR